MKSGLSNRYGKYNMLFFISFVFIIAVIIGAMLLGIIRETSGSYARFYSVETVGKLGSYLNREIALVENVARSKYVIEWFADEGSESKRQSAYDVMTSYTDMFQSANLYFGINASLNEFSVDKGEAYSEFKPFDVLDPNEAKDDWYFDCLESEYGYELNLDVDKTSRVKKVWINYKVFNGGTPVGVFCASLRVDDVFTNLYAEYDADSVLGLIINADGRVLINSTGDDSNVVYEDAADYDPNALPLISDINNEAEFTAEMTKRLTNAKSRSFEDPAVIMLQSGDYDYASIAAVENSDWTAVTFFDSSSLFGANRFLPLIAVLCFALAAYLLTSNLLLRRFKMYNSELIRSRDEKNELAERNHMLNNVAKTLLSAAVDTEFEASLVKGMLLIGTALSIDRIFIWQNETRGGVLCYRSQYRWMNRNGKRGGAVGTNDYFVYGERSEEWSEKLYRGECINGPVSAFPQNYQKTLGQRGIVSMLLIPIQMKNVFWGSVSFDDCVSERVFTDEEVNLLRSGALMLANAVNRNIQELAVREALTAARAASKAKGDFLSNMSHEIRTPLNAIIGMTAIGKTAPEPERKDYAFEKIDGASNHLLGVVNDILDMSKIEAGKFELSLVPFSFGALLKRVATVINFRAEEKKQTLTFRSDERIPEMLLGDDQRLAQVIANLLSNAVKFTPEGKSIRLNVTLADTWDGVYNVRVSVSDEGIGISDSQRSRLFNSFEQAENDTTRKYGGTGLGLAISKHIVEQMGGSLLVKSELGKGSEFYFTVPFKAATEEPGALPGNVPADIPADGEVSFEGRRLLLAEDIEVNREIVAAMLESTLIEIDFAENGAEAVRMVEEAPGRYDLIFMDLQMPLMDGFEATRKIRALDDPAAKSVPIIAMTANVFREDVERCVLAGMNGHLGKPLDFDAVMAKMRIYLKA